MFAEDELVCQQNSLGSYFFIIHSGEFEVVVNDKIVNRYTSITLKLPSFLSIHPTSSFFLLYSPPFLSFLRMKKGKAFGEIALIHNTPRSATVRTGREGSVWAVSRQIFRSILKQLSSRYIHTVLPSSLSMFFFIRNFAENRTFLEDVKIFEMLTETQKTMIANALVVETFENKEVIVSKGEKGDVLYIIKEGKVQVWQEKQMVRTLTKGDYFGERALLYDEPRSATIISVGQTICVTIGRDLLQKVLGNLQHVLFRNVMMIALQNSSIFQQFTKEQLSALIEAAVVKDYPENFTILDKENRSRGVRLFIVLEGDVLVSSQGKKIEKLSRGASFGDEYVLRPKKTFQHRVDSITTCKLALLTSTTIASTLGSSDIDATIDSNHKKNIIKKVYY